MEAVIFDLDGVVVDTEKYWNKAEEEIYFKTTGEKVDPDKLAGMSIINTYEYLLDKYEVSMTEDEFFNLYEEQAEEVYTEKASLMNGLKDFIGELHGKDILVGLATGSYWPDYVIERFDLDFDAVMHSGLVEGDGKPEPETYSKVIQKLGVNPGEALAVEDTDAGIKSAKDAGLYCIGYKGSKGQTLSDADEVVEGAEELQERILQLA